MYLNNYLVTILNFETKIPPDSARFLTRACIYLKINRLKLLIKIIKSSLNEIDV